MIGRWSINYIVVRTTPTWRHQIVHTRFLCWSLKEKSTLLNNFEQFQERLPSVAEVMPGDVSPLEVRKHKGLRQCKVALHSKMGYLSCSAGLTGLSFLFPLKMLYDNLLSH